MIEFVVFMSGAVVGAVGGFFILVCYVKNKVKTDEGVDDLVNDQLQMWRNEGK